MRLACILGPAGSGKSYLLNERLKGDHQFALLTATTGVAALNLGPSVTTLHSALGFYDLDSMRENRVSIVHRIVQYAYGYKAIVVDEVSMLEADMLDELYECCLDAVEIIANLRNGRASQFGLILTGDFLQLPPVTGRYAFKAKCWPLFEAHTEVLTKIWRQTDPKFAIALLAARKGKGVSTAVALVNAGVKFISKPDREFAGTTLYPTRDSVNLHNKEKYAQLDGEEWESVAVRWGVQKAEWKQIPDFLRLKAKAKVMALANRREALEDGHQGIVYANGSIGHVLPRLPTSSEFEVSFPVTGWSGTVKRIQRLTVVKEVPSQYDPMEWDGPDPPALYIEPEEQEEEEEEESDKPSELAIRWAHYLAHWRAYVALARSQKRPYYDPVERHWVMGTINYMPLQLAYALTYHKSQGLTLDSAQIDVRNLMAGAEGMVYVALSRVRDASNLVIVGNPTQLARRIATSPDVVKWI